MEEAALPKLPPEWIDLWFELLRANTLQRQTTDQRASNISKRIQPLIKRAFSEPRFQVRSITDKVTAYTKELRQRIQS